eukprot:TRINITY_DN12041_c0_g1_i1.p1 TRINITY_DN12041_c0_g1~~TRINITY_DN12041_c0_g1_i1.p1  ORF type:complete len:155 (-),score=16.69 TRINITY_DN12041_c0_g1_i1:149-586(-)
MAGAALIIAFLVSLALPATATTCSCTLQEWTAAGCSGTASTTSSFATTTSNCSTISGITGIVSGTITSCASSEASMALYNGTGCTGEGSLFVLSFGKCSTLTVGSSSASYIATCGADAATVSPWIALLACLVFLSSGLPAGCGIG